MKTTIISALGVLLIIAGLLVPCSANPAIFSWADLEKQLTAAPSVPDAEPFESQIQGCAAFKALKASHEEGLFLEMTRQQDYPYVRLAGFIGLRDMNSDCTLGVAFNMILETRKESPDSPYYSLVHQYIMDAKQPVRSFEKELTKIFTGPELNRTNCIILVMLIPYDLLYDWYAKGGFGKIYPSTEAIIIDHIYGDQKNERKPITKSMEATLRRFKYVPGYPRLDYLFYASESDEDFKLVLTLALNDTSMKDLHITALVYRRRELVNNMKLDDLITDPHRREVIEKALHHKK